MNELILPMKRELIALLMGTINYCLVHVLITCGQGKMSISLIKLDLITHRCGILVFGMQSVSEIRVFPIHSLDGLEKKWYTSQCHL